MRVLLCNDDGINAPGLQSLIAIAQALSDDIWIVAPETNQSGAAHSLTLRRPLRLRKVGEQRYAVDGTPTDCILVAMQHLLRGQEVDLVLSGVNHGANLAEDVTYSGTVAAAMEATLFDVRAVALSQVTNFQDEVKWSTAEQWGPHVVRQLLREDWPNGVLMNVNFPDFSSDSVNGIKVTYQDRRKSTNALVERRDPFGNPYYWIGALRDGSKKETGSDLHAVGQGYVSATPINLDMTDHQSLTSLVKLLE